MTGLSARPFSDSDHPLPLGAGEVHICLSCLSGPAGSDTFLRQVLSRYTGLANTELVFERGEHGKPSLQNAPLPLHFSLSHSGKWIACAVGLDSPLGLDLEYREGKRDILKLARRFYHADEYRALLARQGEQCTRMFYDLWTLKEAWVKARGGALGKELESTVFRLGDAAAFEAGPVEKVPAGDDFPYTCRLLQGSDDCSLALCSAYREPLLTFFSLDDTGGLGKAAGLHC